MQTDAENQQLRQDEQANDKKKANLQAQLDAKLISKDDEDAFKSIQTYLLSKKTLLLDCREISEQSGVLKCVSWDVGRTGK